MLIRINLPGSAHHQYFFGTKAECLAWLEEKTKKATCLQDYYPSSFLTNKEANKVRYRDGNKVYKYKSSDDWMY